MLTILRSGVFRRSFSTGKMSSTSSPFTQAVVAAVQNLYPKALADNSFDNTGCKLITTTSYLTHAAETEAGTEPGLMTNKHVTVLLEAPHRKGYNNNSVLLCVDLTKGVADEAIRRKDSVIIAYHPIIFRGLKSLTLGNTQQQSLLRLAQEGISVYSPHTAVDAAPGGLNDFLADICADSNLPSSSSHNEIPHTRSVITPVKDCPAGFDGAGYGRVIKFEQPQTLRGLVRKITSRLGPLAGVSVATPQYIPRSDFEMPISSIGICAGSGGSMFGDLDVDLLFTGELSHHEALAAVENDKAVVTAFHSNTERKFLEVRMKGQLEEQIRKACEEMEEDEMRDELAVDFEVAVSEVDRDPYVIVHSGMPGW